VIDDQCQIGVRLRNRLIARELFRPCPVLDREEQNRIHAGQQRLRQDTSPGRGVIAAPLTPGPGLVQLRVDDLH
jgi:hypothetical protein